MRDILFRGKRIDNGAWVYGCYVKIHDHEGNVTNHISPPWCKVDPETVGQYTGLTDKNGKEVFEGDIFDKYMNYEAKNMRFVVVYDCKYLSYMGQTKDKKTMFLSDLVNCQSYKGIIGNIHDNPELIGGVGE